MSTTITGLTYKNVLDKPNEEGIDVAANWLHEIAPEPKQNLDAIKSSVKRLSEKHKLLHKSRHREPKDGTGRYDSWAKSFYSLPILNNHTHAASNVTSCPSVLKVSQTITRHQTIDLREELLSEKQKCDIIESDKEMLQMKLEGQNASLKRIRSKETYYKNKATKLELEK